MKVELREYHNVTRIMIYNVEDEIISEDWEGSIEEFRAAVVDDSHPRHDEATDLMYQYGHDEEDEDWVSDRKGGYDIEWRIADDN